MEKYKSKQKWPYVKKGHPPRPGKPLTQSPWNLAHI